jgi:hypothetical protein
MKAIGKRATVSISWDGFNSRDASKRAGKREKVLKPAIAVSHQTKKVF